MSVQAAGCRRGAGAVSVESVKMKEALSYVCTLNLGCIFLNAKEIKRERRQRPAHVLSIYGMTGCEEKAECARVSRSAPKYRAEVYTQRRRAELQKGMQMLRCMIVMVKSTEPTLSDDLVVSCSASSACSQRMV